MKENQKGCGLCSTCFEADVCRATWRAVDIVLCRGLLGTPEMISLRILADANLRHVLTDQDGMFA